MTAENRKECYKTLPSENIVTVVIMNTSTATYPKSEWKNKWRWEGYWLGIRYSAAVEERKERVMVMAGHCEHR